MSAVEIYTINQITKSTATREYIQLNVMKFQNPIQLYELHFKLSIGVNPD